MRLLRIFAILSLLAGTAPGFAQGVDLTAWASWVELDSQSFDDPSGFTADLEFDSSLGFGAGANWFWWDRFSTELSVLSLEADVTLNAGGALPIQFDFGTLELTPMMLTFQFHLSPDGRFDPYFGIGAAYVLANDLDSRDLQLLEAGPIEVDDEFTFLLNAGVGIALTPNFGINLDARYLPLEPAARAINDPEEIDLELNPLILSVGFRFRFGL